jgi:tetratricopeptide (TPR) repeat protein
VISAARAAIGFAVAVAIVCAVMLGGAGTARAEVEPTKECGRGKALQELGRLGEAEGAYLEDLKTQASVGCGKEQLEAFGKANGECAVAKVLAASGQEAKAKEAYVKVLEADPESKCAAQALKASPDTEEHWWSWAATAAEDVLSVLGFGLLAIACAAIVAWLLLMIQMRAKRLRRRRPARWLLRPSLEVKPLDDTGVDKHVGPAVASLIRSKVKPRHSGGIDVVTGHSVLSDALQPLGDISAQAKAAVGVVSFMLATLPRREYEASGALQAKGEHGRGISVGLMNRSKQLASTTLWADDFAAPDDELTAFQRLSVPAAAWLDHRIATAMEEGGDLPDDPQSWALFRAGAAWQEDGELVKARQLYESALATDTDNFWAMANLGVIAMVEGNYPEGLQLLTNALEGFEGA